MTKAIMAIALFALCIAALVRCGAFGQELAPTPLPPATPLPAPPALAPILAPTLPPATPSAAPLPQRAGVHLHLPPPEPLLVEELVLYIDAVARVRLLGVAQDIGVEKSSWDRTWDQEPGPYVGVVEFRFEVLEWLKGGDGGNRAVGVYVISNGRSEDEARAKGKRRFALRDGRLDDRESIIFMNNSHESAPSTQESGRYFMGFRARNGLDIYSFGANRTWLPLTDAAYASGASGEPVYLLKYPADPSLPYTSDIPAPRGADGEAAAETLTLTKLRKLIGLSADELRKRMHSQSGLLMYSSFTHPETSVAKLRAASFLGEGVILRWANSGANPDVLGYRILRRKQSDGEFIELADVPVDAGNKYHDTQNVQPDTKYIYRLRAYGADGDIADARVNITTVAELDPLDDATATPIPTATPAPN